MSISPSEAHYIIESCLTDFRIDGRTQLEHRPYTITNRSSHNTTKKSNNQQQNNAAPTLILSNGSSRIHLPGSTTDIICSVKADLVHPSSSKPNEGVLELNVDLSLCGGGGTVSGGAAGGPKGRRRQREEESQITSLLQRLVLPHALNYEDLVVWPGRYVWRLAMDVVVLRCDGCVLDACSIAMREALRETKLPMVRAVLGRDDGGGGGGALGSLGGKENDLTVDGDVKNAVSPSGAEECPLVVTVSVLSAPASATGAITSSASKRNRSISIIDARTEEEACASSRVCVSVDPSGMVCGVHTLGGGGVALDQGTDGGGGVEENGGGSSMPLAMLGEIVTTAAMASKNLYALLDDEDESTNMKKRSQRSTSGEDDGSGYGYLLRNHFLIQ